MELTSTLEEERLRARRLQNERDVQQATAMSHKERERLLQSELESETKKRAHLEQRLGNEREKNAALDRELTDRDTKLGKLQQDLDNQALRQSEKVCEQKEVSLFFLKNWLLRSLGFVMPLKDVMVCAFLNYLSSTFAISFNLLLP